jgi:hypothetical protein
VPVRSSVAAAKADAVSQWLLLAYRIPRDPSASRVYVWRKMKQLGAILVQDAVWVLPATPRNREQFQWLSTEITELQGEATLWTASQVYATDEQGLQRQFEEQVDAVYRGILEDLKQKSPDLADLSKRFQQAQLQDFFQSRVGEKTRERLLAAQEEKPKRRGGRKS